MDELNRKGNDQFYRTLKPFELQKEKRETEMTVNKRPLTN